MTEQPEVDGQTVEESPDEPVQATVVESTEDAEGGEEAAAGGAAEGGDANG